MSSSSFAIILDDHVMHEHTSLYHHSQLVMRSGKSRIPNNSKLSLEHTKYPLDILPVALLALSKVATVQTRWRGDCLDRYRRVPTHDKGNMAINSAAKDLFIVPFCPEHSVVFVVCLLTRNKAKIGLTESPAKGRCHVLGGHQCHVSRPLSCSVPLPCSPFRVRRVLFVSFVVFLFIDICRVFIFLLCYFLGAHSRAHLCRVSGYNAHGKKKS
jgi:hypothetical protein